MSTLFLLPKSSTNHHLYTSAHWYTSGHGSSFHIHFIFWKSDPMRFLGFVQDDGNNPPKFIFDASNNVTHSVNVIYKDWKLLFIADRFADEAAAHSFWNRFLKAIKRTNPNNARTVLTLVEDMAVDICRVYKMPERYF